MQKLPAKPTKDDPPRCCIHSACAYPQKDGLQKLSAEHTKDDPPTCCFINDVCGYSLKEGIVIVAVTTIIVSIITLVCSTVFLCTRTSMEMYNSNPTNAINLITALIFSSTSLYQIVVSILMLWFLRWKQTVLLIKLWDVSNMGLLTILSFLIVARAVIYMSAKEYMAAGFNVILGVIYEVVFIYFSIIVSNYQGSLDPDTLYY